MASTKRIALVTGGMGGLGEAICFKLAALGYTVVTTCSPGNTKAQEWLQAMKQQGFSFPRLCLRCDRLGILSGLRPEDHGGDRAGGRAGQ
jgi:NAD(P)-dependent dehydrogenase (short-subunit alcohol dehydrogenase family)